MPHADVVVRARNGRSRGGERMINYTERLTLLMQDVVSRVPTLSFIDISDVLVFARAGRSAAEGAFATCHCLTPAAERARLLLLARSRHGSDHPPLRVVRDQVADGHRWHAVHQVSDLVRAAAVLRSVARSFAQRAVLSARRRRRGWPSLTPSFTSSITSTPDQKGIRRIDRGDGTYSANCHGHHFFSQVADMVQTYLAQRSGSGDL